jgi:Fe2+ transport system protein FeoA
METVKNYLLTSLFPRENGYVETMTGSNASIGRMASMGITPGAAVLMIRNHKRGPIIIEVRDTLVALGRSEADKIKVRGEGT